MKKISIVPILFVTFALAGCSSVKTNSGESGKSNLETQPTTSQLDMSASAEQAISVAHQTSQPKGETRFDRFNSRITVSFDSYGNKKENRYFENDSRLLSLAVLTRASGKSEARVYGADGRSYNIASDEAVDLLNASPDEIADAAGITKPVVAVEPPPLKMAEAPLPQTPVTVEQPTIEKPVEAVETPKEAATPETMQATTDKQIGQTNF